MYSTRTNDVKIVKLIWSNHELEETNWEAEDNIMMKKCPVLFEVSYGGVTFSNNATEFRAFFLNLWHIIHYMLLFGYLSISLICSDTI